MLRREMFLTLPASLAGCSGTSYESEIAEWRKRHDRGLRSEGGPLYLVGRHRLSEGITEIGGDATNGIRLPDRAPKQVGSIEWRGDRVTFTPAAGVAVKLNGKAISGRATMRAGMPPNPRDKIEFGDFWMFASILEDTCQLTVHDKQSPYLKEFPGAVWFPVDARYRVEAAFTPYPQPKEIRIPDTTGRGRPEKVPGYVTFKLNDETLRLDPVTDSKGLFLMFKDRTSGRETYGGGRFLDAEKPKDGKVVLDFNKAYNPYCAINPYSSCLIPPKQNALAARIEAGEMYRGEH